jgi:hypothetical protein
MAENLDPQGVETLEAGNQDLSSEGTGSWKDNLEGDLRTSPLVQKFGDDYKGLNEAIKSHANLEKLLGNEKVPIPKGEDDVEGWQRFSKALGIPDTAEKYGLADPELPEGLEGLDIDKRKFSEIAHGLKLTPNQAKGLWEQVVKSNVEDFKAQQVEFKNQMAKVVNELRGKWGDAYDGNVHLGQMVINKFAGGNKETEDYLTSVLASDPRGVEFLAKIGSQFAENKIGEFSATRFSLAPEQAKAEIDKILSNPEHPYLNERATRQEHDAAVDYVDRLYKIANGVPV